MLKKLFNNKIFIFIFAFIIEAIFYYFFEYLYIGGSFIIPDIGLAPIFGLMFGPAGALGHSLAMFIFEIYDGGDFIAAIIDFGITFLISITTYKLWYTTFKKRIITTPKLDSTYNIFKFITILFIVSVLYWSLINISLEAYHQFYTIYPLTTKINIFSYFLDMFNFSLILGLLLISIFNIFKIPLQSPKKWFSVININYKYFALIFIVLIIYPVITLTLHFDNDFVDNTFFAVSLIVTVLFCLNKLDVNIEEKNTSYSIIEKIILIFLLILGIIFTVVDDFQIFIDNILRFDPNLEIMIFIALSSALIMVLLIMHIYYVEKIITNPIYYLIDALKQYKQVNINNELYDILNNYSKGNDDVSRLVGSFFVLKKNIEENLFKIKKTTVEKERFKTEFDVASNIQSSMLKTDFNEFSKDKAFKIYGFMNPAREVGGDFYDFFNMDEDNIGFVIGDVSGKGVPATLFMVKTMYLIRNHSKFDENPKEILKNVNNLSCQRNTEEFFVTSCFGKLNLKTGKLIFVNAGHNQPLIRQNNESFEYLNIPPNFVLGVMEGMNYEEYELDLNPGDMIFLYTDGIVEANSNYKEFYGDNRLKETINKYKNENLDEIINKIKNDVYDFCEDENQFDDMTMLIIKYEGCENNAAN